MAILAAVEYRALDGAQDRADLVALVGFAAGFAARESTEEGTEEGTPESGEPAGSVTAGG
jgi:hypothetical protein